MTNIPNGWDDEILTNWDDDIKDDRAVIPEVPVNWDDEVLDNNPTIIGNMNAKLTPIDVFPINWADEIVEEDTITTEPNQFMEGDVNGNLIDLMNWTDSNQFADEILPDKWENPIKPTISPPKKKQTPSSDKAGIKTGKKLGKKRLGVSSIEDGDQKISLTLEQIKEETLKADLELAKNLFEETNIRNKTASLEILSNVKSAKNTEIIEAIHSIICIVPRESCNNLVFDIIRELSQHLSESDIKENIVVLQSIRNKNRNRDNSITNIDNTKPLIESDIPKVVQLLENDVDDFM